MWEARSKHCSYLTKPANALTKILITSPERKDPKLEENAVTILGHHIGGERVPSTSERLGPVRNPATGEITKQVSFAARDETDRAVSAAREAFPRMGENNANSSCTGDVPLS